MKVTIELTESLLGTISKIAEIFTDHIGSKAPSKEHADQELETIDEDLEKRGWTGFHSDEQGLFIYNYMIKGFLKHAGNVMKDHLNVRALRSKISDFVFIEPRKIYLGKDKPDGVLERPIVIQDRLGRRTALAKSDFIAAGTQISFDIELFPQHKEITWDLIASLLDYGRRQGLGQWRNGGYGRFKIIEIDARPWEDIKVERDAVDAA